MGLKQLFCSHIYETIDHNQRATSTHTVNGDPYGFTSDTYTQYYVKVQCIKCGKEKFQKHVKRL